MLLLKIIFGIIVQIFILQRISPAQNVERKRLLIIENYNCFIETKIY